VALCRRLANKVAPLVMVARRSSGVNASWSAITVRSSDIERFCPPARACRVEAMSD
jgi:hypothetical protein